MTRATTTYSNPILPYAVEITLHLPETEDTQPALQDQLRSLSVIVYAVHPITCANMGLPFPPTQPGAHTASFPTNADSHFVMHARREWPNLDALCQVATRQLACILACVRTAARKEYGITLFVQQVSIVTWPWKLSLIGGKECTAYSTPLP
ncbi:hypothetical protein K458DRAFT_402944 [Lentithecium fluviatile CBS 122367]|uniref:Uncharacterized protein n=1 Tax=Lentithecium fluviatile CBS 122367 TaxID=1168545 RepID=A0A6G1J4W6_9PLEO|nr:hypothetical protein K458DRAFT_402944 [Lentithecium fluviatile CBS 122367]